MKTIMLIEDDEYIGNMVTEALNRENYKVLRAYSGTEALLLLEKDVPDLILLDLMLPGLPGEKVLERIVGIPVIVVSAKVDVDDKVSLLLHGASDYITKPFEIKELLARIAVQLRKQDTAAVGRILTAADITINLISHEVRAGNESVNLTKTEFAILKQLMLNAGAAVSKSAILDRISEDTPDCTDNSLKQHISNLRKKLREAGGKEYIEAIWGIGFKLSSPNNMQ